MDAEGMWNEGDYARTSGLLNLNNTSGSLSIACMSWNLLQQTPYAMTATNNFSGNLTLLLNHFNQAPESYMPLTGSGANLNVLSGYNDWGQGDTIGGLTDSVWQDRTLPIANSSFIGNTDYIPVPMDVVVRQVHNILPDTTSILNSLAQLRAVRTDPPNDRAAGVTDVKIFRVSAWGTAGHIGAPFNGSTTQAALVSDTVSACNKYIWHAGDTLTTSGLYIDTVHAITGPDTIITLHLTINRSATSVVTTSICNGSSYAGHTATCTYVDHYTSAGGCDSARTLNLTVSNTITSTVTTAICTGSNYAGHTATGTYVDHYTSAGGCDSARTLNLTVNNTITSTVTTAICQGSTYAGHGASGIFVDHYNSVAGCDSARTLNLTVNPNLTSTVTTSICAGSSYAGHTTTGTFTDHFTSATGCDSARMLNLTVNNLSLISISDSICAGSSYSFNGQSITQAGSYIDTLQTVTGCDSIVALTLAVNALPAPSISGHFDTLETGAYTQYQWIRNGQMISGATYQTLILTQNGNYRVIVYDAHGCTDTSAVYNETKLGITGIDDSYGVRLYPNPNSGSFTLEFTDNISRDVDITDVVGKLVQVSTKVSKTRQFNMEGTSAGIYFVNIIHNGQHQSIKFTLVK